MDFRSLGGHASLSAAASNAAIAADAIASVAHPHGSHVAGLTTTQSVAAAHARSNPAGSIAGRGGAAGAVGAVGVGAGAGAGLSEEQATSEISRAKRGNTRRS